MSAVEVEPHVTEQTTSSSSFDHFACWCQLGARHAGWVGKTVCGLVINSTVTSAPFDRARMCVVCLDLAITPGQCSHCGADWCHP